MWLARARWMVPVLSLAGCANRGMEAFSAGLGGDPGDGADASSGGAGRLDASGGAGRGGAAGNAQGSGGAVGNGGAAGSKGGSGGAGAAGGRGGISGGMGGAGGSAGAGASAAGSTGAGGASGGSAGAVAATGGAAGSASGGRPGGSGGNDSVDAGGPRQVILSVDFVGSSGVTMGATEIAGVKAAMNWNSAGDVTGTLTKLVAADGSATTASVSWSSNAGYTNRYADAPGNARMMNGYLDPGMPSAPATVTVSGLPSTVTAAGYDVYLYATGFISTAVTRTYQYAIGATTETISQTGPPLANFPGFTLAPDGGSGNYIVFHNLTGATFTLKATPGTGEQMRAPVNGLQIVSPAGS